MISNGSFRLGPSSTHFLFTRSFCPSTITFIPIERPIEPSMTHETKDIGEKYRSIHLVKFKFRAVYYYFRVKSFAREEIHSFRLHEIFSSIN